MAWNPEDWKLQQEQTQARSELTWAENQMKKAALSIMDALKSVHEKKSWRFDYPSFEEYCEQRLKITRGRAYQILSASNVRTIMMGAEGGVEASEGLGPNHYAELKSLPAERMVEVVEEVKKEGPVTAKALHQKINGSQVPEKPDLKQQRLTHLITLLKEELARGPITQENVLQVSQRLSQKIYTLRTKPIDVTVNKA